MQWIDIGASLVALIVLEIILGIDNVIFLSILTDKLPREQRKAARQWGLTFAWMTRLLLLATACLLVSMSSAWITLFQHPFSLRDLFLLIGGVFLLIKATQEIHFLIIPPVAKPEHVARTTRHNSKRVFLRVVLQVALMDIIFSLDSVLTAVGLTNHFWIMASAITVAIAVMMLASEAVSKFIDRFPTIKMLALSFLILIGVVLVADGLSFHIPRGYIYFAMAFSLAVEALNLIRNR